MQRRVDIERDENNSNGNTKFFFSLSKSMWHINWYNGDYLRKQIFPAALFNDTHTHILGGIGTEPARIQNT